ncbi:RraA family protein [Aquibacillus saliphilus]|uniref:RraA family protein n=1 Tax=Aquibacillus saliphilus TaxID=1909422 RepID=UPI001CF022FD|nr:RraA family protein [Aquibacillus saliphilus]
MEEKVRRKDVPTTCFSDALNGLCNLEQSIKPVKNNMKVYGEAYTVKVRAGDNKLVLKAIGEAKKGDVLVIDSKGYPEYASGGEFVIGLAKTLGLSGVIIDGVVRDIEGICALNFPVFCKGTTVAASEKRSSGETNIAISCGGQVVRPGDLIVGDVDGVVVIPQQKEEEIIKKATKKMQSDEKRANKILGNPEECRKYINDLLTK